MIRAWAQRLDAFIERRSEIVGINRRNVELVYAHNKRRDYPIADDKLLTKKVLSAAGVPVPETLGVCPGLVAIPTIVESLRNESHFVVKPANGSGGSGIVVVQDNLGPFHWRTPGAVELSGEQLRKHLADVVFGAFSKDMEDKAFIERRVAPHDLFQQLWPDGLCDVRVITLRGQPLMSMVRVPTRRSRGKANLHQGGIGLAIDLHSGTTTRAVSRGQTLTTHPESQQALIGLTIPGWREVLDVARKAACAVPLGYLGIDLVIDRVRGPLVLEINARPGLEIQNVNGFGLGRTLAFAP